MICAKVTFKLSYQWVLALNDMFLFSVDLTLTCVSASLCQENEECNTTTEECDCLSGYGRDANMTCTGWWLVC